MEVLKKLFGIGKGFKQLKNPQDLDQELALQELTFAMINFSSELKKKGWNSLAINIGDMSTKTTDIEEETKKALIFLVGECEKKQISIAFYDDSAFESVDRFWKDIKSKNFLGKFESLEDIGEALTEAAKQKEIYVYNKNGNEKLDAKTLEEKTIKLPQYQSTEPSSSKASKSHTLQEQTASLLKQKAREHNFS